MNIYFEPVNLKQWNMFKKVENIGHIEPFLATKSMQLGDLVLLHVGKQDKNIVSGVYAYGRVVKGPYILLNSPEDYCNGKNTVDVNIEKISYNEPLIDREISHTLFSQFRTVHKVKAEKHETILTVLSLL